MNKSKKLSFEKFSKGESSKGIGSETFEYNNFYLHFVELNDEEELFNYRRRPYFKRFKNNYRDLEERLTDRLTNLIINRVREGRNGNRYANLRKILEPHEQDLYRAYELMREYVESDQVLFS